jgi:hypothetical protein
VALLEIKKQVKEASINEGVMEAALFSCRGMRHGGHHLYDDLDKEDGGNTNNNNMKRKQINKGKSSKVQIFDGKSKDGLRHTDPFDQTADQSEKDNFEQEFV